MKSCLYKGAVFHKRSSPFLHQFNYNVLYYFLNLNEVDKIFRFPFLFSFNFPGILSFWRKDYFGNPKNKLVTELKNYLRQKTGDDFDGSIFILTNISYLGFCFNPVSFYYFYDQNKNLKYLLSEITNTPWGEKHSNLFKIESNVQSFQFKKDFHVSPFIPMNVDYTWKFNSPDELIDIHMENRDPANNSLFFEAKLNLKKKELTLFNIIIFFFLRPLMTFKTVWGIYFQALILFLRKAPFYNHPSKEIKI